MPTPLSFLFCLSITVRIGYAPPVSGSITKQTPVSGRFWMFKLPQNTPINEFNIPATHDTSAFEETLITEHPVAGHAAQTQVLNIENQLYMGVRFMDLRLRWFQNTKQKAGLAAYSNLDDGYFGLAHGVINFHIKFNDALDTIKTFLHEHDTETVVVLIWAEKWIDPKSEIGWLVRTKVAMKDWVLNKAPNDLIFTKITTDPKTHKPKVPTMSECKGKIVLMMMGIEGADQSGIILPFKDFADFPEIWEKEWNPISVKKHEQDWANSLGGHIGMTDIQGFHGVSAGANSIKFEWKKMKHWKNKGTPKQWAEQMNPFVESFLGGTDKKYTKVTTPVKHKQFLGVVAIDFLTKTSMIPYLTILSNYEIYQQLMQDCPELARALYAKVQLPENWDSDRQHVPDWQQDCETWSDKQSRHQKVYGVPNEDDFGYDHYVTNYKYGYGESLGFYVIVLVALLVIVLLCGVIASLCGGFGIMLGFQFKKVTPMEHKYSSMVQDNP